jgi:hypothetical protein
LHPSFAAIVRVPSCLGNTHNKLSFKREVKAPHAVLRQHGPCSDVFCAQSRTCVTRPGPLMRPAAHHPFGWDGIWRDGGSLALPPEMDARAAIIMGSFMMAVLACVQSRCRRALGLQGPWSRPGLECGPDRALSSAASDRRRRASRGILTSGKTLSLAAQALLACSE